MALLFRLHCVWGIKMLDCNALPSPQYRFCGTQSAMREAELTETSMMPSWRTLLSKGSIATCASLSLHPRYQRQLIAAIAEPNTLGNCRMTLGDISKSSQEFWVTGNPKGHRFLGCILSFPDTLALLTLLDVKIYRNNHLQLNSVQQDSRSWGYFWTIANACIRCEHM